MTKKIDSYVVERDGLVGVREHWMPGNYRRGTPAREKRPFENEPDARAFLIEHGHGPDWRIYRCHVCSKYHVSKPERK